VRENFSDLYIKNLMWRVHQDSGVRGILEAVNRNRAQDAGVRDSYDTHYPNPKPFDIHRQLKSCTIYTLNIFYFQLNTFYPLPGIKLRDEGYLNPIRSIEKRS